MQNKFEQWIFWWFFFINDGMDSLQFHLICVLFFLGTWSLMKTIYWLFTFFVSHQGCSAPSEERSRTLGDHRCRSIFRRGSCRCHNSIWCDEDKDDDCTSGFAGINVNDSFLHSPPGGTPWSIQGSSAQVLLDCTTRGHELCWLRTRKEGYGQVWASNQRPVAPKEADQFWVAPIRQVMLFFCFINNKLCCNLSVFPAA